MGAIEDQVEDEMNAFMASNYEYKKIAEIIIVSCVCGIIFSCFCTPIIIYATSSDVTPSTELRIDEFDIDNCSQQMAASGSNGLSTFSSYYGNCSHYDGICSAHLNFLTNTNSSLITMSNNDIQEQQISEFLTLLNSGLASEECSTAAVPFMCQYVYPPCNGDGNPLFITQEQCVNIRDDVCANEWMLVMNTELRSLLPVCEEFREDNNSSSVGTIRNVSEPLKCHYQFDEYCGVCLPLCGKFSQYRVQTKLATRILIIFSAVLEFIGGNIFLIASIIRRKEMLVYPQVLEVCHVVSAMVLAAFVLIAYVGGQERLFCSHRTLYLSFLEPSVFTQIMGFVIQFCFLFMAITWFFYVFHLFLGLAFPFWSARLFSEETRKLKICVLEIFGAFIFSGTFPTIVLSMSDFRLARFPPVIVIPSKDLILYTLLLPIAILLIVGVNLTFLSFWIIHKTKGILK
ncbi:uncharacterized protein [Dysidea avara]|uniref:uncharacterized protein n=1 Tax=Dysidea avara TaxID=196820 RepID=UPI00332CCC4F